MLFEFRELSLTSGSQRSGRRQMSEAQSTISVAHGKNQRPDDEAILGQVQALMAERPTYGYRRATAMINTANRAKKCPAVNHKRVYRVMKENNLLLERSTGKQSGVSMKGS